MPNHAALVRAFNAVLDERSSVASLAAPAKLGVEPVKAFGDVPRSRMGL
jgi:hypothetical protein